MTHVTCRLTAKNRHLDGLPFTFTIIGAIVFERGVWWGSVHIATDARRETSVGRCMPADTVQSLYITTTAALSPQPLHRPAVDMCNRTHSSLHYNCHCQTCRRRTRIRGFLKWYALYKSTFYLLTYLLTRETRCGAPSWCPPSVINWRRPSQALSTNLPKV